MTLALSCVVNECVCDAENSRERLFDGDERRNMHSLPEIHIKVTVFPISYDASARRRRQISSSPSCGRGARVRGCRRQTNGARTAFALRNLHFHFERGTCSPSCSVLTASKLDCFANRISPNGLLTAASFTALCGASCFQTRTHKSVLAAPEQL
jgi:hypothetical protein